MVTYGFYNAQQNSDGSFDRVYDAKQVSMIFDGIIDDGVYRMVGQAFRVTPGSGLKLTLGTGRAWFNHTWTYNDTPVSLTVPTPHASLPRIDSVVLEVNETTRTNRIFIKTGTPAASPVAPSLTNTDYIHQHLLSTVRVDANVTSIAANKITNMVGTTQTPYVIGILEEDAQGQIRDLITNHIANRSNPHSVTKAQVGLGNVSNLADKDRVVKGLYTEVVSSTSANLNTYKTPGTYFIASAQNWPSSTPGLLEVYMTDRGDGQQGYPVWQRYSTNPGTDGKIRNFIRYWNGGSGTWTDWVETGSDTWKENTRLSEGYVKAGASSPNKIWRTDGNGNPDWRDYGATSYVGTELAVGSITSNVDLVVGATGATYTFEWGNPNETRAVINTPAGFTPVGVCGFDTGNGNLLPITYDLNSCTVKNMTLDEIAFRPTIRTLCYKHTTINTQVSAGLSTYERTDFAVGQITSNVDLVVGASGATYTFEWGNPNETRAKITTPSGYTIVGVCGFNTGNGNLMPVTYDINSCTVKNMLSEEVSFRPSIITLCYKHTSATSPVS